MFTHIFTGIEFDYATHIFEHSRLEWIGKIVLLVTVRLSLWFYKRTKSNRLSNLTKKKINGILSCWQLCVKFMFNFVVQSSIGFLSPHTYITDFCQFFYYFIATTHLYWHLWILHEVESHTFICQTNDWKQFLFCVLSVYNFISTHSLFCVPIYDHSQLTTKKYAKVSSKFP